MREMEFRILGPLEVRGETSVVTLGGTKPGAVLAMLLMHPNEPVSAERLARALWGDDTAPTTVKTVQVHVSRLRKALGDGKGEIVATTSAGYRVRVRPGELDAQRFEELVEHGRRALAAGQAEKAAAVLREADGMWEGPPLADLADVPFAADEIARLEEERLAAIEARVEAEAAAGKHAELVSDLRQLFAKHPTRERLAGQLMLALYRCGRQAEALETYQRARRHLTEEIGIEPGPELKSLHEAILHQDPSLKLERLPHQLAAAATSPLVGRPSELRRLLELWERAEAGAGALVAIAGAPGMGKTRLAAEVAVEAHRSGAAIAYVSGMGPPAHVLRALQRAGEAKRPTLLVLDDVDDASADVVSAMPELARALATAPTLVLATGTSPETLALLRPNDGLSLEPLGLQPIRAIVTTYVPDHDFDEPTAEALLGASGGAPRRVHELAGKWKASRNVETIAERAEAGRAELRTMEDDLADSVVELQEATEHAEPGNGDAGPLICPFKGLASFEAADAPYFFGRDRLVAELVAQLVGASFLAVVGPSGSGKSSALRAGLLPALENGVLPGSMNWAQRLMRPGEHPSLELERATMDLDAGTRLVLAVDQFEETFTACRDEEERTSFIAELVRVAEDRRGSVVVVALRADFYGRCAAYPRLARLLAANQVLVGPMRPGELQQAIVCPAERVGLHVERGLVAALIHDVKDAPGALPLLSTALLELWRRRDGRRLDLESYRETGGVLGAVARLAENAFGQLDERQQALARTVLLRLAEVEPEGGVERRRLPLEQLESEGGENVASVIGLLADARLLTVSSGAVEFAHEALLREWPRLREWIEDDRENLRVHRSVSSAAEEWIRLEKDEGALYRGARLAEAEGWAKRGDPGPTGPEREFLDASLERERHQRKARHRRLAFAFAGLGVALVAIAAVAIVALNERRTAVQQQEIAQSRELALQSANTLAADPGLSLALAIRAMDTSPTAPAVTALRQATLSYRELAALPGDSTTAETAAFSPSGEQAVGGGSDGVVHIWDVTTRRETARLDAHHGGLFVAHYSRDAEQIALGFEDGTVAVTDPSMARLRSVLQVPGQRVSSVAFNGDGTRIAAGFQDGTVRLVAGDGTGATRLGAHGGEVLGVDVSADATRLVSAGKDGVVRLWNVADSTFRDLHTGNTPQTAVNFSPDGKRVLAAGHDGFIRLWDIGGRVAMTRVKGEGRQLLAAAFSADGRRFAAGGQDGAIRVWSSSGGTPVAVLRSPARVFDVGFGAASDRVISAGGDGTVRIWDAGRTQAWTAAAQAYSIDFNNDGRLLVGSGAADGTLRVWDASTGRLRTSLAGRPGFELARFSPRDDSVVIIGDRDTVRIWRIGEEAARDVAKLRPGRVGNAASFDGTGQRIVYADDESRILVHDLRSGTETPLGGHRDQFWDVRFSPDGRRVAAASEKGALVLWRLDRPAAPERVLRGHVGHAATLAFSPDGERIATAGEDRTVRVWRSRGGRETVLRGHEQDVTGVAFTRDGRRVLSSSGDGTVRLWDVRGGESLAVLDPGDWPLYHLALSRDGKIGTLADRMVRTFRCDVCGDVAELRALARSRAARTLTPEEKLRFLASAP
jgi:WD40 repeat protein/DNA-binding SARP family transcriptional activator